MRLGRGRGRGKPPPPTTSEPSRAERDRGLARDCGGLGRPAYRRGPDQPSSGPLRPPAGHTAALPADGLTTDRAHRPAAAAPGTAPTLLVPCGGLRSGGCFPTRRRGGSRAASPRPGRSSRPAGATGLRNGAILRRAPVLTAPISSRSRRHAPDRPGEGRPNGPPAPQPWAQEAAQVFALWLCAESQAPRQCQERPTESATNGIADEETKVKTGR